ncbi:VWA domain-containing protein [Paenalkalicoccus suaedae]|uniref:VWA domain-containing protein n=1 Tax=Paenalkalicoccus suaedae TaxID=2592382 RepID=A0A859FA82_9BACI|nr:VWA domain-containing protein [Paenalkalicoccus suaedae]QKS69652.1 VWA domain-containing protein [Paenalkalicoccus suaedae]
MRDSLREGGNEMKRGTLRQILVITDGCSNQGEDPVAVATLAKESGYTVNVVGVVNHEGAGMDEITNIAQAGGGMSDIVRKAQLSQTVQMVTRKAMTQTIYGVVHQELKGVFAQVESMPPEKQEKLSEIVEEISEEASLHVVVLVDTSLSMKDKLPLVQEALQDLSLSLSSRMGENMFCVYSFPGKRKTLERRVNWTDKLDSLHGMFEKLRSSGVTPTGPALAEAIDIHATYRLKQGHKQDDYDESLG